MNTDQGETPTHSVSRRLVLEYLIHHCYGDTATALLKDIAQVDSADHEIGLSKREMLDENGNTANGGQDGAALSAPVAQELNNRMDVDMESLVPPVASTNGHGMPVYADPNGNIVRDCDKDGVPPALQVQWNTLESRRQIVNAILSGSIPQAIDLINKHFPQLINTDPNSPSTTASSIFIAFKLNCQQFIETVRTGNFIEALSFASFAQANLGRLKSLDPDYDEHMEIFQDVTALIAYPNPEKSPIAHYLGQHFRETVANEVNSGILALCGSSTEAELTRMVKQVTVVHDMLDGEAEKKAPKAPKQPKWDLAQLLYGGEPETISV
ncbi:hypothetical protein BZG36_00445 [Bifiguratus adelaidae]|uniref:CTLH domain-containing protein n=1 Tax=Bifiguratus adelaidae TaxID=1938954 RepID=A0A261Y870_9FUNG|nr:hypothetical protein BZG36_00445 [Bifiguratus adelaidae]